MEPALAEIRMAGFNFAPRGFALCDGQILPINQNQSLYSLLGTNYGGDGRTTFALPDCRGRMVIGEGDGAGLSTRRIAQKGGVQTVTLTSGQIPSHTHTVTGRMHGSSALADDKDPEDEIFGAKNNNSYASDAGAADETLGAGSVGGTLNNTGGSQAHNNMPPYQTINYIIALQGTFPSRN